jgi:hypothetical protein
MSKVSLSEQKQSIEFVWNWYLDQSEALLDFRKKIFEAITNSTADFNPKFIDFTVNELNEHYKNSKSELEHLVCFDLISATEATLRSDFLNRVYGKDKSNIGRIFRHLEKIKSNKISLEQDIIEHWKTEAGDRKPHLSGFISLLKYRHWLAHGRYWTPKFGQQFTPIITYDIAEKVHELLTTN